MKILKNIAISETEMQLVKMHCENYSSISIDSIVDIWRDNCGILCIMYRCGQWFHYSNGWY